MSMYIYTSYLPLGSTTLYSTIVVGLEHKELMGELKRGGKMQLIEFRVDDLKHIYSARRLKGNIFLPYKICAFHRGAIKEKRTPIPLGTCFFSSRLKRYTLQIENRKQSKGIPKKSLSNYNLIYLT